MSKSGIKDLSPVKLTAQIKDYIWGGTRLITDFGKKTNLDKAAESWELSTHPDGESVVSSGMFSGLTLSRYIAENGIDCIGENAKQFKDFPVLIKLIDAKGDLSIQVHPSDEYALEHENQYGKTEMWYIVDCDEGAYLYYGLNREITREELRQRIENNTILEVLNKVEVKKGDVFFIPSGTIHAICAGILICEVQQNSNITYRVYDYNRRDANGNTRQLHVDKAIEVTNLKPLPKPERACGGKLASCKYFTAEKVDLSGSAKIDIDTSSFRSLIILDGEGSISVGGRSVDFKKGDSIFVPAQDAKMELTGNAQCIMSYV